MPDENVGSKLEEYFSENPSETGQREFVETLVNGVIENRPSIDKILARALENWELSRLGYMERAILRMGAFEIAYQPATPDKVAINEAIELAKTFCELESIKLVNGALDHVMSEKTKSGRDKDGDGTK